MTVYAKIENNKLICASNNLGITGLADSPELCLANGFTAYTEEQVSGYYAGSHQIIDGVLTPITNTDEYIAEQKAEARKTLALEYKEHFNEVNILCALKFALGLCTQEQITAQRTLLQTELTTKLSEV